MTSTAAVTIAVAAAATATAIAVGPRIGLLRRRRLSLLGDAVFAGAEAAWVLMSSGPRAAPAWSNHASGGVAPAGHRFLNFHCFRNQSSATTNARTRNSNFNADLRPHNYCNVLPSRGWRATHIRPLVCVLASATSRAGLAPAGCNSAKCLTMFRRCGVGLKLFTCVASALLRAPHR